VRIFDRIAHPGLCTQMDDMVEAVLGERSGERRHIGKIDLFEAEAVTARVDQPRQPVALQLHRIIVVEIVDADHVVAARQQLQAKRHADEAGSSGDENFHVGLSSICSARRPPAFVTAAITAPGMRRYRRARHF
jgi:hypothetical protein